MIVLAFRWWWLLRIQGLREPLGRVLSLTWAGYLAALLLPGACRAAIWREPISSFAGTQSRARAFSAVLADRFLGLHSLFCLGALSALWIASQGGAGTAGRAMTTATLVPLTAMTLALTALLRRPTRRMLFRILPGDGGTPGTNRSPCTARASPRCSAASACRCSAA